MTSVSQTLGEVDRVVLHCQAGQMAPEVAPVLAVRLKSDLARETAHPNTVAEAQQTALRVAFTAALAGYLEGLAYTQRATSPSMSVASLGLSEPAVQVVNSINSVARHEFHHALNGQGRNDTDTRAARVASIYDRVKTHIHSPLSMAGL
ncbi:MAG: hypothetical protein AB1758_15930, partial [Candidatus Eremiobacterota bacterium]